jgi:hypothetical protein
LKVLRKAALTELMYRMPMQADWGPRYTTRKP